MSTLAARITTALTTMAGAITQANGYETDAGLRVYRGRAVSGPDDLAAGPLVVIEPTQDVETETPVQALEHKLRHELRLTATAVAMPASLDDPLDTAHALLGDLKRALVRTDVRRPMDAGTVLGEEIDYRGATLTLPEPGEVLVSAAIHLAVRYSERRGDPTTA